MKKRNMHMTRFKEVTDYHYEVKETVIQKGTASLIHVLKVTQPIEIRNEINETVTMLDQNFEWMQIAYQNENYWIHVFYNTVNEMVQIYIDIVDHIDFSDSSDPVMDDIYIDIIIDHGKYSILDYDEFEQAYRDGDFNEQQYIQAKRTLNYLCNELDTHMNQFLEKIMLENQDFHATL